MSITHEQIDVILEKIAQNPAIAPENTLTLKVTADALQNDFNTAIQPFLDKAELEDDVRDVMEKLFLISEWNVFTDNGVKFFMNLFGDSVAIFGVMADDGERFKLLNCVYVMPETPNETTLASLVLASFVKVLLPNVDAEKFLRELTGDVTRDGIKFSIAADSGLIFVTAVAKGMGTVREKILSGINTRANRGEH